MFPYILLLVTILLMTLFDGKKYDKIIFSLLVLWMFIFAAFRVGGTGTGDYDAYLRLYSLTDTFEKVLNPEIHAEIGFRILSFLGHFLGFSGQYIIVAMAFLSIIPVTYVIYKYSPYKILSLLVWMPYFLTMNIHSSRTSVAAGFGLLFILYFYRRKLMLALGCILLAISFHTSALILMGVLLYRLSLQKLLYILLVSSVFVFLTYPLELIYKFLDLLGLTSISYSIQEYILSESYGYPMALYDPRLMISFFVIFLIVNYKKYIEQYFPMYYFKIYFVGFTLMILFSSVTIIAWRGGYFLLLVSVIVIPMIAKVYNDSIYRKITINRVMSFFMTITYTLYSLSIILKAEEYNFFL